MSPFPDLPADDLRAFLRAIQADPEEDAPRLVFADWLDEHADPRAELMRAGADRDPARAKRWGDAWLPRWLGAGRGTLSATCLGGLLEWSWGWDRPACAWAEVPPAWRAALAEGWVGKVSASGYGSSGIPNLTTWEPAGPLSLSFGWGVRAADLAGLAAVRDLRGLEVPGADPPFDWLARLPTLWCVGVHSVVSDESAVVALACLPELYSVRLHRPEGPALARLAAHPRLRSLALTYSNTLTSADLAGLSGGLRVLDLTRCPGLDDAALARIGRVAGLRKLVLTNCDGFTGDGLEHLAALSGLQELDLSFCIQLPDDALRHLSGLSCLRKLNLRRCTRLTDAGLRHLAGLTDLRELNLSHCWRLTGEGLGALAGLPRLRALSLERCDRLTDEGVACLADVPTLETLDLGHCPSVSDEAVDYLRGARPGLAVTR